MVGALQSSLLTGWFYFLDIFVIFLEESNIFTFVHREVISVLIPSWQVWIQEDFVIWYQFTYWWFPYGEWLKKYLSQDVSVGCAPLWRSNYCLQFDPCCNLGNSSTIWPALCKMNKGSSLCCVHCATIEYIISWLERSSHMLLQHQQMGTYQVILSSLWVCWPNTFFLCCQI